MIPTQVQGHLSHIQKMSTTDDENTDNIWEDVNDFDEPEVEKIVVQEILTESQMEQRIAEQTLILSLSTAAGNAFDFTITRTIDKDSLIMWEKQVDSMTAELQMLSDKPVLLGVYGSILKRAALKNLDPLQMATFQLFSSAIMDSLVKLHPPMEPITSLIDEVTDVHLDFVDKFQPMIDDGGDEG